MTNTLFYIKERKKKRGLFLLGDYFEWAQSRFVCYVKSLLKVSPKNILYNGVTRQHWCKNYTTRFYKNVIGYISLECVLRTLYVLWKDFGCLHLKTIYIFSRVMDVLTPSRRKKCTFWKKNLKHFARWLRDDWRLGKDVGQIPIYFV